MSYESPIEIVCREMKNQLENDVYSVVQSYGIKVDKGELINALEYDRNQYKQGYADAKAELERKKGEWIDGMLYYDFDESEWEKVKCSVCENFVTKQIFYHDNKYHYCPYCGADMRGDQ